MMLTIYTALYGGRDKLRPAVRLPGVRVVCYTDVDGLKADGVEVIREITMPRPCPARSVRWHKTHPPRGDSLWLDASFQLIGDPRPLLKTIKSPLALIPHPTQRCIYHEAIQTAVRKKDDPKKILRQAMRYIADGFPSGIGMYQGGVIYRRADCPRDWQEAWWYEIDAGSFRDQISLPYVLWKFGIVPAVMPDLKPNVVIQRKHEPTPRVKWKREYKVK